ncbi:NlpC/P60 family protein [Aliikangiella coralliicola]|uniref:NlpC/P60 domain-containing protein n=1 Tax=Aliikangiella coralliicola TaxID=2592383 RepID=A0A545UDV2_9GAMM|nr:NlpC/P60 family protein [Aliikangiella coralliicola]TQV87638.1 hypothetical protein FLL46_12275 [Aliikangiella coralliicola]
MKFKTWLIIPLALCFWGCSHRPPTLPPASQPEIEPPGKGKSKPAKNPYQRVKYKLLDQYKKWRGTPYRLGGLNKQGIDCSGFVYQTFRQQLNIQLPRTTIQQSKSGRQVDFQQLKAGDLIFFKTGKKLRHVGIYIDGQQFIHASTSQGVMISTLDNPYWRKSFWKVQRVWQ